jgi:hypothetical protein
MSLSNICGSVADCIFGFFNPLSRFEHKLTRCQAYRRHTVSKWHKQTGLPRETAIKLLRNFHVFDGQLIRELIRNTIKRHPDVFGGENLFVTGFGPPGKSGGLVLYDFTKSSTFPHTRIETSKIAELPTGSRIIFVDDMIGTGTQSLGYIQRLSTLLSPSHVPYLFSVCATSSGIKKVQDNSVFEVLCGQELEDAEFNHYCEKNETFTMNEKGRLIGLNGRLGESAYGMGLLIAFYYTTPNNTMPIIWKDGARYTSEDGSGKKWFALIPRSF